MVGSSTRNTRRSRTAGAPERRSAGAPGAARELLELPAAAMPVQTRAELASQGSAATMRVVEVFRHRMAPAS